MGVETRKPIPLPAPTETESHLTAPGDEPTDVTTDVSKTADNRSHYSLPDDGTPLRIKTRGHQPDKSQTSLLIEYFESSRTSDETTHPGRSTERRPSVRVRLTPSKTRGGKNDHIQITETRSGRVASVTRHAAASPGGAHSEFDAVDTDDAKSMHSYASATEESNVSRHPIEVDIDPSQSRRRRKVSSPLIPAADSKASHYVPPDMSDISAIPTDSFLDGSGGNNSYEKRARSPLHGDSVVSGAAAAAAGAIVADRLNNRKTRSASHDRSVMQKAVEKASKPEKRHKSKNRSTSSGDKDADNKASARRKSKPTPPKESVVSDANSSTLSSQLSPSHRSHDPHSASINNPRLLETVEDAIRRLILPELDLIKRERSQRETKTGRRRDSRSSLTTSSLDELSVTSRRRSGETAHSATSRDKRDREARNQLSPTSSIDQVSALDEGVDEDDGHHTDGLAAAALGAAAVGAAIRSRSRDDKRQRRRRRAETPKRSQKDRFSGDFEEPEPEVMPPMPLSSEANPSDMTRTSILTAETDRPHSASEEMTPVREVAREVPSMDSMRDGPTPTRTPDPNSYLNLQGLGTQHANISHGDLKALPRRGTADYQDPELIDMDEYGRVPEDRYRDEYDEYDEEGHLAEPGIYDEEEDHHPGFFGQQDVPEPLRYVPYQQERRGLSPIQSVSGYTEGSDIQGRSAQTASELSSPTKSQHGVRSSTSIPSNMRSREFADEEASQRSSGVDFRNANYTDDSELGQVTTGQAVRHIGGNPQMVHQSFGPESAVASLVEGSALEPSQLSGSGHGSQNYRESQLSYDEGPREVDSRGVSPVQRDQHTSGIEDGHQSPAHSRGGDSQHFSEYELNEYGQKVPRSGYRQSPTESEAAITSAALGRAAALQRKNAVHRPSNTEEMDDFVGEGVSRNRSFKERTQHNHRTDATPRHSVDRLSDYEPKLGASGLPDTADPMPEIGYGYDDMHSDLQTPSVVREQLGTPRYDAGRNWEHAPGHDEPDYPYDGAVTPKAGKSEGHGLGLADAAAAATIATAGAALAANHSRQPSQEQDDEWQRTSGDGKRLTWVTNPYEDASPIANLPGADGNMMHSAFGDAYRGGFNTGSPGMPAGDEGYISAAPNDMRGANIANKGLDLSGPQPLGNVEDPFYTPQHNRQLSGMSQGMASPLYDPATGTGIDRIQSKDIIALMEHLMVRDAQRSARDTELLVTLVRSAAEMRNSFNDIKRILADTEEQIIGEVQDNTEKTVKRHLGGPRPFPGSSSGKSVQAGSQSGTVESLPSKKRSFLRRALQGLSARGEGDLGRVEDMLMQLLTDVDVLKHQTANDNSPGRQSVDNLQPEVPYEQDRGYEPEGQAGTSTTSHTSQSGHLPLSQARGPAHKPVDRKFSDHRISTVPEDNEDEFEETYVTATNNYSPGAMRSPATEVPRGGSVPLGTPPQHHTLKESLSSENTPRTDDSKKHKSKGSAFFPKISRWSETTTSSLGKVFRSSGNSRKTDPPEGFLQHPPSRSGSNLGDYDAYHHEAYPEDRLQTGISEHNLPATTMGPGPENEPEIHSPRSPAQASAHTTHQEPPPATYATPEDPKYRAHRNSVNLQHPQPKHGPTERFRTALEFSAQDYDTPMSPRSTDWAGSSSSLHRFPGQNPNRYSDNSGTAPQASDDYRWAGQSSPSAQGPPRPPKEPLDGSPSAHTPARHARVSEITGARRSPMPYQGGEAGYSNSAGSYRSGSPRSEHRSGGSTGVPARRPTGPRAMTPTRGVDDGEDRRRKRDTFGAPGSPLASPRSVASQESETF